MYTEKYYYLRNVKNVPYVTVCLVMDEENNVGRGIAICSNKDIVCKKRGRSIAKIRAIHAMKIKKNALPIARKDADAIIAEAEIYTNQIFPVFNKATYNYNIQPYEKRILKMEEV